MPQFAHQPAHLVALRGARPDEALARPVGRQHGLLFGVLDRHEAHVRPGYGLADGFGIARIVFVALHVVLHDWHTDAVPESERPLHYSSRSRLPFL